MAALLELIDVHAGYGPVTVLNGLALQLQAGERLAMIGRNGVGKTTALRAIMGLATLSRGRIVFDGQDLHGLAPLIRQELLAAFTRLGRQGETTLIIVEQQVREALCYTDRALILDHGAVAHAAPARVLQGDAATLERFVGMAVP